MAKKQKKSKSHIKNYFSNFNFLGSVLGILLVCIGFLPSLLPRGWLLQGVLSGVFFAVGYAFGVIISHFVRKFKPNEPDQAGKSKIKLYVFSALSILYLIMAVFGFKWQQQVRNLVEQQPAQSFTILPTIIVTVLIIMFILLVARSIRTLYWWLRKVINKHIPKPIAYTGAWVVTILITLGILNGVILNGAMTVLNNAYGVKNDTTDAGIVQPTDPHMSGSNQSLIAWNTLGRQGRNFIGRVPSTAQLSEFNQTEATQPIRIYAGLESSDNTLDRAKLAVDDLKRAGGFDRKIIVVVTTTGTGWVDEAGVKPVEYMYNGDSAVVSMQYSYLPSSLSFLVDQQKAKDAGNQLYSAVYGAALDIPEAKRPKIVVFGESLGSYGGEAAFANFSEFRGTSDGAVWAGPPNFNILRKTATQNREAGSPEILPIFQNGETVRFAAKAGDFKNPDKPWGTPKATYLENSSDPIVWWSPNLLFNKPDWLSEKRGADVSPVTRYIPIVTFFQVSGDMVFSTGVPDGHGHKYGNFPTDAWSYVAPPSGWTAQKTEALKSKLSN